MSTAGDRVLDSLSSRIMQLDDLIEKQNDARFSSIDTDTEAFVKRMQNCNTARKTVSDVRLFKSFLGSIAEFRNPENISPSELGSYLARFFLNVHKADGTEYEPTSLKAFQSSVNRYLSERNCNMNILTDESFKHSRDVLKAKCKSLKQQGKGNKPQEAEALTKEEISILYSKGQLGTGSPSALINTVWWNNTTHFGMRSRQEHIDMRWGDVQLVTQSTGEEYVQYQERSTKTRTGTSNSSRPFPPKMFALPGDPRCPVATYKQYKERRPDDFNEDPDSPFYLSINTNANVGDEKWFSRQNMGKNKIGTLMKTMCANAGIQGRKVNHSARKTTVSTLVHSGVAPTEIMQVTGHKNLHSINNYSSASVQQQKKMSNLLAELSSDGLQNMELTEIENIDDQLLFNATQKIEKTCTSFEIEVPKMSAGNAMAQVPSVIDLPLSLSKSENNNSCLTSSHNLFTGAQIHGGSFTINITAHETMKKRRVCVIDSDSE